MLRPSYSELMEILNEDKETDVKINSRYSIVIAAAKRARQIIDGAYYDEQDVMTDKAVSIAINEMLKGKIKIVPEGWEDGEFKESKQRQNVAISADVVIQEEGIIDYHDDLEDEIFEEDGRVKDFSFVADDLDTDETYGEADEYSEFDYEEDNIEMPLDEEDDYSGNS